MDYKELPERIQRELEGDAEIVRCDALVVRAGRSWTYFSASLGGFGYSVIYTDRGVQPMTLALELSELSKGVDGVVLVTASTRLSPLVEEVKKRAYFRVASFGAVEIDGLSCKDLIKMDSSWLWGGERQ